MKRTSVLLAAIFNLFSAAAAVWETGSYTPGEWEPSVDNLPTADGVVLTSSLARYTKDNPVYAEDAGLSDGVMPGAAFDATKVVAIVSGSVTWNLGRGSDIYDVKIFTRWGDGGRDGIAIGNVEVSSDNETWTVVSSGVEYGTKGKDGNNSSSGALYARLSDENGSALAVGASYLRVTFPARQDNGGSGYVEIEACGVATGLPCVLLNVTETSEYSAQLSALVRSTGAADAADLYFAYGPDAEARVPKRVTTGLAAGSRYDIKLKNLDHNTTYHYTAYLSSGSDNKSEMTSGTFKTARDPCRYLPEEYVQVEYIKTSGKQCVNTGVKSSAALAAELDFIPHEYTGNSYLGYGSAWRFFQSPTTSHKAAFDLGNDKNRLGLSDSVRLSLGTRYFVSVGNFYLTIQNEQRTVLYSNSGTEIENVASGDVYLAASGGASGYAAPVSITVYSLVMKEGDAVVRDFVPCSNTVDKVYGLYDVRQSSFYPFIGEEIAALVVGPEVLPIKNTASGGLLILVR